MRVLLGVLTILACSPIGVALQAPQNLASPPQAVHTPYLMLVTFYDLTGAGRLSALDDSPFDGIAVPIVSAYDSGPQPSFEQIQTAFVSLERQTRKQVWPWVFINRMVGIKDAHGKADVTDSNRISALDLDNRVGAQGAFLNLWQAALRQAKSADVPGVVLDMELYSNPNAYSISFIASQRSLSVSEVKQRLNEIGEQMAQIASKEFPDAIVWTLISGLSPNSHILDYSEEDSTCRFILLGLMDGARQRDLKLMLVDGGEDSLGYCHKSGAALNEDISAREQRFTSLFQQYRDSLTLGGTIVLWRDSASRSDWLTTGQCGSSDVRQLQEFSPYLRSLFQSYRFVWIYAATAGKWDPLDPAQSEPFYRMLRESKESAPAAVTGK
jgi:hypothetical protein